MEFQEDKQNLMGGQISIVVYETPPEVSSILFHEIYKEGLRLEKIFNFFDEKSELSILNKHRQMNVSFELLEVIKKAIEYSEKTNGTYDISLGKNIRERKSGKEISKVSCSYKDIKLNGNEVILGNKEVQIDLGSIAKGYIVDKIVEFIKRQGIKSFFIDARGDILAHGKVEEIVGVKNPRKNEIICKIALQNSAVATSGDYNQYHEDYTKSHILNQKEIISVTVVADTLIEADVFASAVFVLEKKQREILIQKNPKYKVYTIDKDLNEKYYNGFKTIVLSGENNEF